MSVTKARYHSTIHSHEGTQALGSRESQPPKLGALPDGVVLHLIAACVRPSLSVDLGTARL